MPYTDDTIDRWFTYHTPSASQREVYANIHSLEMEVGSIITAILNGGDFATYAEVNLRTKEFARYVNIKCPDGVSKDRSLEKIRLVRNALNEAISLGRSEPQCINLCRLAEGLLLQARWQACTALACGGD